MGSPAVVIVFIAIIIGILLDTGVITAPTWLQDCATFAVFILGIWGRRFYKEPEKQHKNN